MTDEKMNREEIIAYIEGMLEGARDILAMDETFYGRDSKRYHRTISRVITLEDILEDIR